MSAAIGGIASGAGSYWAAEKTATGMRQTSAEATQLQMKMFETARGDLMPWMQAGEKALGGLEGLIAEGPGEFVPSEDPGYKFGYEEFVEKPTLRGAAARGGLRSGATEKALTRYASDYASTKYDNFLARYYDKLKPYQSLAGLGQTSATAAAGAGTATGASVAGNILSAGTSALNARLAGYSGLAYGLSSAGQNALNYYSSLRQPASRGSAASGTISGSASGASSKFWGY